MVQYDAVFLAQGRNIGMKELRLWTQDTPYLTLADDLGVSIENVLN